MWVLLELVGILPTVFFLPSPHSNSYPASLVGGVDFVSKEWREAVNSGRRNGLEDYVQFLRFLFLLVIVSFRV